MINFKKILKHPLFSGSILMIGGNMFANVINYLYQVIMKRNLGLVGYGELSSIFAIFYIATIVPISASPSIIKFISSSKNRSESVFIYKKINEVIVKVSLVLGIFVLILSPFLADFLHVHLTNVLIIAPVVFFSLITVTNQSLLQGVLNFWGNVGPNILSSASKLIFGIIFVFIGWKVFGAVAGVFCGTLLAYLYSYYLAKGFLKNVKAKGKFDFKKFLKYSLPVLIFSFAFTSFFTMDVVLVKHFFSDLDAGIYATLSILGKIIYFAASPIAGVMFPIVAGKHSKGERYFELLLISLLITIFMSLGIVAVYALFPHFIIGFFGSGSNLIPVYDLIWMGLFICFYTVSFFMMNFFLSIDKTKLVILPLVFATLQIVLICMFHSSLLTVIQISFSLMLVMFLILFSYLVYNRFEYAKKRT
ncbi:MAG TPA: oligosaccharide flippase family protein [Patescibacteria group bacterium]|nr:oligosaccharide flippase family protein [Patescibacteria group bacterium]